MKRYIGTKIIHAEPSASNDGPEGTPGYKVTYADGYTSWSPKQAFDEAYRECNAMTFGLALEALKKGLKVSRSGWNGKGLWLELQIPDAHSKMTLPYVYMNYPVDAQNTPGARVPWLASQTDMLAEDWSIVS
jgi:hypothetical protein